MKQPLIGITTESLPHLQAWRPHRYGQNSTYSDAIWHAGGAPVLVPHNIMGDGLRTIYDKLDGIVLSGGYDIHPRHYGEAPSPGLGRLAPQRDEQELQLFAWAQADKKPILAICRGMQLVNVARGGSLYQHLPDDAPSQIDHTGSVEQQDVTHIAHDITIGTGSQLAQLLGVTTIGTNSLHHQAIKKLGTGLAVAATAADGTIEAIEDPNLPFLIGVQGHPETLELATPIWRKLFAAFIAAAR